MKKFLLTMAFSLSVTLIPSVLLAGWAGPEVVASGTWGKADNQFSIESTDMGEIYPTEFFVLDDGSVIIQDGKFKIYRNKQFARALDLDGHIEFCDQAIIIMPWAREDGRPLDHDLSFYPSGGKQGWTVLAKTITGHLDWVNRDCSFVTIDNDKVYRRYSSTGKLLQTMLHPDRINHEYLNNGRYRITIKYDDALYSFMSKDQYAYGGYVQDRNKLLYGMNGNSVDVMDRCGKIIDSMELPKDMRFEGKGRKGHEQYEFAHDEYGEPFVDAYGNVYTWKRTPASFSILKWTRKSSAVLPGSPDPPTALKAVTVASGLYLTWLASPQDPGCVTGYEISRATAYCGVYSPLVTVDKGVLKHKDTSAEAGKTYYYKARALAGKEYSAWALMILESAEVCPGDNPISKIIRYFSDKTYTADHRQYTPDDVEIWRVQGEKYSENEKRLLVKAMRNEIYARHGRLFESPELKQIFENASWYKPKKNFSEAELNTIEKKNVELIMQYEKKTRWR